MTDYFGVAVGVYMRPGDRVLVTGDDLPEGLVEIRLFRWPIRLGRSYARAVALLGQPVVDALVGRARHSANGVHVVIETALGESPK